MFFNKISCSLKETKFFFDKQYEKYVTEPFFSHKIVFKLIRYCYNNLYSSYLITLSHVVRYAENQLITEPLPRRGE